MKPRALLIGSLLAAVTLFASRLAVCAAPASSSAHHRPAPAAEPQTRTAAVNVEFENPGFETGNLDGWQYDAGSSDIAVLSNDPSDPRSACFQPDMPSEGVEEDDPIAYMACMSTGTFFGGSSNGGVRSDLTSGPIAFTFRPASIKISFDVDFQSEEPERSIGHNDAFEARLVTVAGTFPIVQLDTFGRTVPGRGLRVENFDGLQGTQSGCDTIPTSGGFAGIRTGRLTVTWTKPFDPVLRATIGRGPVFLEFSISGEGDQTRTSIACIDDVKVKATKPSNE